MSDNDSMMLMIASSGAISSLIEIIKTDDLEYTPIKGIKHDLKHFKSRFGLGHSIETSLD